ncbi:FAD-binding and (Fe-S)-binding domain-containing protein [Nocardioides sp. MH1]|uniref:FAD-binding and (Fe-S)-binding domain-containing protein n=1 Tax=Nocardioides sp. MH1 TaxID=3242490 RepID=UPI00351F9BE0
MSDARDLVAELVRRGVDADASSLTRALYSTDASLYRVLPAAVARPRHRDELEAVLEVAATAGSSVTMRGAGTSIAGNAVGEGVVVDTRRLDRVLAIDPEARTARVEPGVVHASLQAAAAPHGLRYGPDPSTHTRCTIGGMVGNNACGSRALGYGRTSDTIVAADVLWADRSAGAGEVEARLAAVVAQQLAHVRTSFGRFSRQVSGYSLEHLLPERLSVPRFFAGSEGTLGLLREVTVSLVPEEPRDLLVLGYPSMIEAADAVPAVLGAGARLIACEGLDSRIVELVRARGGAVPDLPRGEGWLFVEVAGADRAAALAGIAAVAGALDSRAVTSAAEAAALWRIREDGAGLAARSLGRPAYSGWEDAAVPPERLGAWLRDFDALLREHRLDGVPYGHFGDGCVHVRVDFDFSGGAAAFREFLVACAERLAEHGGSLSGEHGDGRARSELLPLMYDDRSLALFAAIKHAADPDGLLNPGVLVDPRPFDADLRPVLPLLVDGPIATEVHRCTGVGKCVAPSPAGVMCPSYVATRDEKDSTRGRARVLQEAVTGGLAGGLTDPAVLEALDLCVSCKGCASDCPTGVDMAEYKSEVLHRTYDGRRRPRSHYALGRLPRWARLGAPMARVGNVALRGGPFAALAKAMAGVDQRRSLPALASPRFSKAVRRTDTESPDVWIWADSFTEYFRTGPGLATIAYLEGAGLTARVIDEKACCALTWTSTGQRDTARKVLERTTAVLTPYLDSGVPVLGVEPSCTAALRSDAGLGVVTLAELVTRLDLRLPDLSGVHVVAQPHCHHSSVLGWGSDRALLERAGAHVTVVSGCCGLAGNWGVEKGHYETSVAIAESYLLPAVRAAIEADPGTVVLADGLSCALQLDDLAGVRALHLAELLTGAR